MVCHPNSFVVKLVSKEIAHLRADESAMLSSVGQL